MHCVDVSILNSSVLETEGHACILCSKMHILCVALLSSFSDLSNGIQKKNKEIRQWKEYYSRHYTIVKNSFF